MCLRLFSLEDCQDSRVLHRVLGGCWWFLDLEKVPDFLGTWPSPKIFSLKMCDFSTIKKCDNSAITNVKNFRVSLEISMKILCTMTFNEIIWGYWRKFWLLSPFYQSDNAEFATKVLIFYKSTGFVLNIFFEPKYFLETRFPGSTTFSRSDGSWQEIWRTES